MLAAFDRVLTIYIASLPVWLSPVMRVCSLIGQPFCMGSTLILFLYISAQLGNARIAFISLTLFACLFISSGLKVIIKRPRPRTYVPGLLPSYSFPSGHAYGTVLVGALLVFIMSDYGVSNMAIGALLVTASIVLTGVSRVYLGAHYPSDVIGGWILGAIVITLVLKTTLLT